MSNTTTSHMPTEAADKVKDLVLADIRSGGIAKARKFADEVDKAWNTTGIFGVNKLLKKRGKL